MSSVLNFMSTKSEAEAWPQFSFPDDDGAVLATQNTRFYIDPKYFQKSEF